MARRLVQLRIAGEIVFDPQLRVRSRQKRLDGRARCGALLAIELPVGTFISARSSG
jgi:hypothetical protein